MTSRPLDGIRVVDLTHVLAGPYCSYQLGLLGADVIKVAPLSGDLVRPWRGTREQVMSGMGTGFMAQNAGKRSLSVDISQPEGSDLVLELAEELFPSVQGDLTGEQRVLLHATPRSQLLVLFPCLVGLWTYKHFSL